MGLLFKFKQPNPFSLPVSPGATSHRLVLNFNNSSSKVKITYRVTGDKPNRGDCRHKDRIPTDIIEVIRVVKIK